MTDSKRPRGRPPLDPEERRIRRAAQVLVQNHKARADRVMRSLFLTPVQEERLERLMAQGGYGNAGALVEALVEAEPEPPPAPS